MRRGVQRYRAGQLPAYARKQQGGEAPQSSQSTTPSSKPDLADEDKDEDNDLQVESREVRHAEKESMPVPKAIHQDPGQEETQAKSGKPSAKRTHSGAYKSDSSDDDDLAKSFRPTFRRRVGSTIQETAPQEASSSQKDQVATRILRDTLNRDQQLSKPAGDLVAALPSTSDEDEEQAYAAWKERELARLKRDRLERMRSS
eukprot:Clim_evm8s119 gene=Clim_evmTU8s119